MSGYTPDDDERFVPDRLEPLTNMERDALHIYAVNVLEEILAELRHQHTERKFMIDDLARIRQQREDDP